MDQVPPNTHVNRMGLTPKGHNTGKWRLITDLSYPRGASVNDGIDPPLCSLSYTSVDDVANRISAMGNGTLMAKTAWRTQFSFISSRDYPLQLTEHVSQLLPVFISSVPDLTL